MLVRSYGEQMKVNGQNIFQLRFVVINLVWNPSAKNFNIRFQDVVFTAL